MVSLPYAFSCDGQDATATETLCRKSCTRVSKRPLIPKLFPKEPENSSPESRHLFQRRHLFHHSYDIFLREPENSSPNSRHLFHRRHLFPHSYDIFLKDPENSSPDYGCLFHRRPLFDHSHDISSYAISEHFSDWICFHIHHMKMGVHPYVPECDVLGWLLMGKLFGRSYKDACMDLGLFLSKDYFDQLLLLSEYRARKIPILVFLQWMVSFLKENGNCISALYMYSKTCVKWPLKNRQNMILMTNGS